jgi:hypothetical protein
MMYVFMFVMGALAGASAIYILQEQKRKRLAAQELEQVKLQSQLNKESAELREGLQKLQQDSSEFASRRVKYDELVTENEILKRDLQNIDVNLRKLQMDRDMQGRRQDEIDARAEELGGRYLKENVKWIGSNINANNYQNCKDKLVKVIDRCRGMGMTIEDSQEAELLEDLKKEFEKAVRVQMEREEQARIKARIREEQRLEREIQRELKQLDRERAAIEAALEKALAEAEDEHAEEVQRLKERLAEAEAKSQRAKARAEMTRSGHVYVISNIGSFGEDIYKIGMTRRLEPNDRVRELSSASVPFPFDVHMMISADDAPTLETALHQAFYRRRINKANPRKEFFRVTLDEIRQAVQEHHGEVDYIADAEALEWRQSVEATDEDSDYIESVYASAREEFGDDEEE